MTISKALRDFEKLETAILKDGKVDWDETLVLLDFIRPYVNSRNKRFIDFEMLLTKCRKDGKIDADESKLIIDMMLSVKRFLKMEKNIETIFVFIVGTLMALALGMCIFR